MKRIIDYFLQKWKNSIDRMPLLIRGARQVGKTYAVRELGKSYDSFVEINLEKNIAAHKAFEGNLEPKFMLALLEAAISKKITPGKTLLFLDEIQAIPRAITALRYFYEEMPELHIVAAGSLLDFAIAQVGIPVGRVEILYVYPISFVEYLAAVGENWLLEKILDNNDMQPMNEISHQRLLNILGQYLAFGGMPAAVASWIKTNSALHTSKIHTTILEIYRQDFAKYAREHQIKYVELVFREIPRQIGRKFKYSAIDGEYRKRELAPALELLVTAGIVHKIYYAAGQGIPVGAQIDPVDYKVIFLDTGLTQTYLGLDLAAWFLEPEKQFINKGALVEAFVGQEILAYSLPDRKNELCYWHKESSVDQAEIDYLVQIKNKIIPIEVKAGDGRTLRSMHSFLEKHQESPYGIKFSTQNYSVLNKIYSYPLYAIGKVLTENNTEMQKALRYLSYNKD